MTERMEDEIILKQYSMVRLPTDKSALVLGGWHKKIVVVGTKQAITAEWGLISKHKYVIPLQSISSWKKGPYKFGPITVCDIITIDYENEDKRKTKIEIMKISGPTAVFVNKGDFEEYLKNLIPDKSVQ
ncbi:hypothetical protein H0O00_02000 [Candidatus Micrarchaeota archaeon]|nr:hypothetical protein [Candidatus Micrarchaeota archaeon]